VPPVTPVPLLRTAVPEKEPGAAGWTAAGVAIAAGADDAIGVAGALAVSCPEPGHGCPWLAVVRFI